MKVREIADIKAGAILSRREKKEENVEYAFASDLMSDVLKVDKENVLLITGLANLQAIRTSEMPDINCIVFARNKKIGNEIITLADEVGIILIESPFSVFRISGEVYKAGLKPLS